MVNQVTTRFYKCTEFKMIVFYIYALNVKESLGAVFYIYALNFEEIIGADASGLFVHQLACPSTRCTVLVSKIFK